MKSTLLGLLVIGLLSLVPVASILAVMMGGSS